MLHHHDLMTDTVTVSSVCMSQRTNVISCVTVHDSDSSTTSPLTPLTPPPHTSNQASTISSHQTKSLAVVAPSVKAQGSERGVVSHARLETGETAVTCLLSPGGFIWV